MAEINLRKLVDDQGQRIKPYLIDADKMLIAAAYLNSLQHVEERDEQ